MNPDEIVLELATEIVDVFFSFEMREEIVKKKQLRSRTGDGTAQAREIMQLAEGTGEGRLTTLVWTRYDDHALPVPELKVVANNGSTFGDELAGQGQIEALIVVNFLASLDDARITEIQSRFFEAGDMLQIGDIELDFSVEGDDRVVLKIFTCCVVIFEC